MKKIILLAFVTLFTTSSIMADGPESEEPKSFVLNEKNCVDQFILMVMLQGSLITLAQQNREIHRALNTTRGYEKDDNTARGIKEADDLAFKINDTEYEKAKAEYKLANEKVTKCLKQKLLPFVTQEQFKKLQW